MDNRKAQIETLKNLQSKLSQLENTKRKISELDNSIEKERRALGKPITGIHAPTDSYIKEKCAIDAFAAAKKNRAAAIIMTAAAVLLVAFVVLATVYITGNVITPEIPEEDVYLFYLGCPVLWVIVGVAALIWAGKFLDPFSKADFEFSRKTKVICVSVAAGLIAVILIGYFCLTGLMVPSKHYDQAAALEAKGNYYEAYLLYEKAGSYKDSKDRKAAIKDSAYSQCYDTAMEAYNTGDYETATQHFTWLGDYKDSAQLLQKIPTLILTKDFQDAQVGDVVTFGQYSRINETPIPLNWVVLAKEEGRVLVMCQDGLFHKDYHEYLVKSDWENCSLREYMNGKLMDACFDEQQRQAVLLTRVENPSNPDYGTPGGNATEDYLYLLSVDEFYTYLTDEALRKAKDINGKECDWRLRTLGKTATDAAIVTVDGQVDTAGYGFKEFGIDQGWIRPVMWIDIGK